MNPTEIVALGSGLLIAHHHVSYPALASWLGRRSPSGPLPVARDALPLVTVVMPAHNEAAHIAAKIAGLAALDYPADRLRVLIACDGCSDATEGLARAELARHPELRAELSAWEDNRGKIATLNHLMAQVDRGLAVFTDVSAVLPADTLLRLAAWFQDDRVGAVGAGYRLHAEAGQGEAAYWSYQRAIKGGECRLGGLLGAHGACYAIRAELFEPLPADTINDDFAIPVAIALQGWRTLYDPTIVVTEGERTAAGQDAARRRRIGAGNMQQLLRHPGAFSPHRPGLALAFASGKALRAVMPFLLLLLLLASLLRAHESQAMAILAALQLAGYGTAALAGLWPGAPAPLARLRYAVGGYLQSGIGALAYLVNRSATGGPRARAGNLMYAGPAARAAKRGADIAIASLALLVLLPVFPLIALAIRIDSPGPVFFRQMRVGRALHDRTDLFMMIKFRSMRQDAEAATGAVWALKRDPRITRTGNFLRKTRLDELPQLFNVLAGDMSIVGPRPERPGFYSRLEEAIPFYAERTFGLRPGITGLAQVCQGYDETIEDVRTKVMYDHAYAASIARVGDWARSDLGIALRTVGVMVMGRGR